MGYNYLEKLRKYRKNKKLAQKILQDELEKIISGDNDGLTSEVHDITEALGISISEVRRLLKRLTMEKKKQDKNLTLLEQSCNRSGVNLELVQQLIELERSYRLKDKRMGIYDKIEEMVEKDEN